MCLSVQQSESLSPTQLPSHENNNNNVFPGEIVCLRNISVNTLCKGDDDDDDDADDDNNNNNNNNLRSVRHCFVTIPLYMSYIKIKSNR